ncbi:helicase [Cyanidiococcus yangmingshanensis]|uniref:Helicase n=1 Tax=Cyanidiococcus yangmingshanensis TaxID=2690220 RepID=A0A7J7IBF3_9RHOD|nr:helicase [Cyanidiococcus yangmingshanensis]
MPLHPKRDLHLPGVLEAVNLEEEHLQALERERARQSMAQETTNSNAYVEGDADELGGLAFTGRVMESKRQPGFSLTQVFQPTQGDEILFGVRLEELEAEEEEPVAQGPLDAVYADSSAAAVTARPVETPLLTERLDAGLGDVERTLERLVLSSERIPSDAFASRTKQTPRSVFAIMDESDPVDFEQKIPHPALEFPFELDRFQKQAILHVERGECVFVAAHTSAGKTAVAEYAIALSRAHATKAIYTSPIKTLSNQKFRDFCVRFGAASVGLITGDVSIQPTASCLIMTTEILRSMLYRGADLIRDVEWVIFDEVHYVNDEERGVVWEEVIILLPEHVNLMMLSATVPNAREFAEWVGRCKQRTVYVISTSYRPVPLQHYLFAKNDLILVKNARGEFLRQGYKAAQDAEREALTKRGVKGRAAAAATVNRPAWSTLVHFLRKRDLMPAVVFCFSRKRCEEAADSLGSMDLLQGSASDGNRIHVLMESALSRLSDADRRVPQIGRVRDLLRRGIGVHHAGLLPIVKEMTEILFQRGLVRVLFATETFAMGVNMPARTVVFSGIRKHDGRQFRLLTPGEYTQMSGRAGRRGLDAYGLVILFFPPGELPSELDLKRTMTGVPPRLSSQFRLSYNMILNLIRTEHVQVEEVIRRSFTEAESFAAQRRIRRLLDRGRQSLERLDAELASFGDLFAQYYQWVRKVVAFATSIHETLLSVGPSGYARTSAVPGRLLLLRRSDGGVALGVILGSATEKRYRVSATSLLDEIRRLVVPVLALIGGPALAETVFETAEAETEASASSPVTVFTETVRLTYRHRLHGIEYCLGDAAPSEILTIYQNTIELGKELPALERALFPVRGPPNEDLVASLLESLRSMAEVLDTQLRQEETSESTVLVPMNPRVHCGLADLALEATWLEKERILHNHILRSACLMDTYHRRLLTKAFALAERRYNLEQKLEYLSFASSYRSLQLLPDYVQRLAVLQRLGYVERAGGVTETDWEHDTFENGERAPSSGLMVTLKGRAACEVGTCDSLLLVETILEGTLSELNPSGIAALLSCLVFQEKLDPTEYMLPEEAARIKLDQSALDRTAMETLATALSKLRRIALALGTAQAECGLPVSPSEYQSMTVNPGLLLPALLWAQGAPFKDVCQWTPVQEGSIVRTIVRLCELLRETADVARVIGDSRLLTLVDLAIRSIKRDIIFAASLYVT